MAKDKDTKTRKRKRSKTREFAVSAVARSGTSIQIQRCRFVKWEVSGVVAATSSGSMVVVARRNGRVEVISVKGRNCVVGSLPGGGAAISSLALFRDLVAVGGLDGFVRFYDYRRRVGVKSLDSQGGAIWSLALSPDKHAIAAGCEDGSTKLVEVDELGNFNLRRLSKGGTRVTALEWSEDSRFLISGDSEGGIRKVEVASGKILETAQLSSRNEDICVWCISYFKDSILTGDSRGIITVWNSEMLLAEKELAMEGLAGDVTSMCVLGNAIFAGAANGGVGLLERSVEGGWVIHRARRAHLGDVRAIVRYGSKDKVMSAGEDSVIAVQSLKSFLSEKSPVVFRPSAAPEEVPFVQFVKGAALALYDDRVEVWQLPSASIPDSKPTMLLRLKPGDLGGSLVAASIAPDLGYLVVSGPVRMAAFQLKLNGTFEARSVYSGLPGIRTASFVNSGTVGAISMNGDSVLIMDVNGHVQKRWIIEDLVEEKGKLPNTYIQKLDVRVDGAVLILTSDGSLHFMPSTSSEPIVYRKASRTVLISLHPTEDSAAVVTRKTMSIITFNEGECKKRTIARIPETAKSSAAGVSFIESCDSWALHGADFALLARASRTHEATLPSKKARGAEESGVTSIPIEKSTNIIGMGKVHSGVLAVADWPWERVVQSLPPTLPRKLFAI
ncbi:hypothetical protein NDN08_001184 [Rhodosorus marinus]|uniref:Anaphase-promoting complex subunit 4-like WD40 domain-containing protein n=1 Tax=Rhodosorus marinus TaxID=101924 RepID=A0AAV8UT38_9RHOD|nr:hypothetical protein NDN08_001184 [Rhodosorus marinus]